MSCSFCSLIANWPELLIHCWLVATPWSQDVVLTITESLWPVSSKYGVVQWDTAKAFHVLFGLSLWHKRAGVSKIWTSSSRTWSGSVSSDRLIFNNQPELRGRNYWLILRMFQVCPRRSRRRVAGWPAVSWTPCGTSSSGSAGTTPPPPLPAAAEILIFRERKLDLSVNWKSDQKQRQYLVTHNPAMRIYEEKLLRNNVRVISL